MRGIPKRFALNALAAGLLAASLICGPAASRVAAGRQDKPAQAAAGSARKSKRGGLQPSARLRMALDRSAGQSPLLPVLMHTLERGLKGAARQGSSPLDAVFDKVAKRHPAVPRALMQKFVADWNTLPAATRQRVSPSALHGLDVTRPLEVQQVKPVFRSLVRAVPAAASPTLDRTWMTHMKKSPRPELKAELSVSRLEPAAPSGYSPGQTVTARGLLFSKNKAENTVVIYKKLGGGSKAEWKRVTPDVSNTIAMEFKLPADIAPGQHFIKVEVKRPTGVEATKNFTDLYVKTPTPPAPVITSVSPQDFKPGQEVVISGQNFNFTSYVYAYFKPLEGQPLEPYNSVGEVKGEKAAWNLATVIAPGQVKVRIPDTLFAGKYLVTLYNFATAGTSNWVEYNVRPYRYKVNFKQIVCKDESDPEWTDNDEIVAAWVVAGDEAVWDKLSALYSGFSDGTVKAFGGADQSVFVVDGNMREVNRVLGISTLLFEWDAGDVQAANRFIGFVSDLAAAILGVVLGPQAGAMVQQITPFIQQVVSWLGGNPDNLGRRDLYFSAYELYALTANATKSYTGELHFDNNDDTGSYKLTYTIFRE